MEGFLNRITRATVPYVAGEQPSDGERVIKINTNENPFPPSPRVAAAVAAEVENLRLYPSPNAAPARRAFAERYGVDADNVFVSNGSDEALAFAFMAFWDAERPLATPSLGYSFYPVYAQRFGVPLTGVPMRDTLWVDVDALCKLPPNVGVILANPNAPTSIGLPPSDLRRILDSRAADTVVLVDEAYATFSDHDSALTLLPEYGNLLVVRTLSKSHSLAGMRVGFAAGSAGLMDGLARVRDSVNSYVADRLAIVAAAVSLDDTEYEEYTRGAIITERDKLSSNMRDMGFELPTSGANFVFARHPRFGGREIFQQLRQRGIIVRRFNNPADIDDYLRITVGTAEECAALVRALREIVE